METFKYAAVEGTHLAQVFAVKIKHINGGDEKCEIYGNILVQDERGDLDIYNKEANEFECVFQGGTLSLAQLQRPTYASTDFTFCLDLKDANGNEFIKKSHHVNLSGRKSSLDNMSEKFSDENTRADIKEEENYDEVFDEKIGYDIERGMGEEHYDKCIGVDVEGEMGVVTVYFCLLKVAVPVRITTKFELCARIDSVEISGSVVACYGKRFDKGEDDASKYCRVVLFRKESDEGVVVDKASKDPLSKSLVAVPAYSSLILEGKVRCVYSNKKEEEITVSEELPAQYCQVVRPRSKGLYGDIELQVFFAGPRQASW